MVVVGIRIYKKIGNNKNKITEALKTVGLESLKNRRIGELSGGELQRVFIAKCLVKDPLLIILDEPVTSVDVESQTKFYDLIKKKLIKKIKLQLFGHHMTLMQYQNMQTELHV